MNGCKTILTLMLAHSFPERETVYVGMVKGTVSINHYGGESRTEGGIGNAWS